MGILNSSFSIQILLLFLSMLFVIWILPGVLEKGKKVKEKAAPTLHLLGGRVRLTR